MTNSALAAKISAAGDAVAGSTVFLDGSTSDASGATFTWSVISANATAEQIVGPNDTIARFRATATGSYVVQLELSRDGERSTAVHLITVAAVQPVISGPTTANEFGSVQLDASRSERPDGAHFTWSVDRTNEASVIPDPSAPEKALLVVDGTGDFVVTVTVAVLLSGEAAPVTHTVSASHTVTVEELGEVPPSDQEIAWQQEMVESRDKLIADISVSADKWEKALTAFLTLFSTVAFIAGPKLASDVSSPSAARFSLVVIGVALVLAFVARVRIADAAAPLPSAGPSMTAAEFGARKYAAGKYALERLRSARSLAVAAALLIAAGALILAWASVNEPSSPTPEALIRTTTGVVCGELSTSAAGVVTVAGQQIDAAEEVLLDINCNVATTSPDDSDLTFPPVPLALAVVAASVTGAYAGSRRSVATMLLGLLAVVVAASLYYTVSRDTPAFSEFDETWMLLAFCAAGSGLAFLTARPTGEVSS